MKHPDRIILTDFTSELLGSHSHVCWSNGSALYTVQSPTGWLNFIFVYNGGLICFCQPVLLDFIRLAASRFVLSAFRASNSSAAWTRPLRKLAFRAFALPNVADTAFLPSASPSSYRKHLTYV